MLKVVLDTSVFVSAILSKSDNAAPRRILNFWYGGEFALIMTPQLLQELVGVLVRRKIPDDEIEDLVAAIGSIALQIPGAYESTRLDEIDPDDNKFLAAAYEAKADKKTTSAVGFGLRGSRPTEIELRNRVFSKNPVSGPETIPKK